MSRQSLLRPGSLPHLTAVPVLILCLFGICLPLLGAQTEADTPGPDPRGIRVTRREIVKVARNISVPVLASVQEALETRVLPIGPGEADRRYEHLTDELDISTFSFLLPSPASTRSHGAIRRVLGLRHLLTAVGAEIYIEERSSQRPIQWFRLADLFPDTGSDAAGDAFIVYDIYRDRWVVVASSGSKILMALSDTEDPADSWHAYVLEPDTPARVSPKSITAFPGEGIIVLNVTWESGRPGAARLERRRTEAETYTLKESDFKTLVTLGATSTAAAIPQPTLVSPDSGTGPVQQFGASYLDSNGAAAITTAQLLINSRLDGTGACWVWYDGTTNRLGLANDAGTAVAYTTIGFGGTLVSNSQCTLNGANSSAYRSGNQLQFYASLTFTAGFGGTKALYMNITDNVGSSGWEAMGSWTVPSGNIPPGLSSVLPAIGSGPQQTFNVRVTDPYGAASITRADLLFNSALRGSGACWVTYVASSGQLALVNDAGSNFAGFIKPGANTTISNGQCTISGANSYVNLFATTLDIYIQISFNTVSFTGPRTGYAQVSAGSLDSGWQAMSDWTVPSKSTPPSAKSISYGYGSGTSSLFYATFSDPNGSSAISQVQILFNASLTSANGCWIWYNRTGNQIGLTNDSGTAVNYAAIGSNSILQNSQCGVNVGSTYVYSFNTDLNLNVSVIFNLAFGGTKAIYMQAAAEQLNSGWGVFGSWTLPSGVVAPGPIRVSPNSITGLGSAVFQTLSETVSETVGANMIDNAQLLINSNLTGVNACWIWYDATTGKLGLVNDAGTAATYITPGTGVLVQNSQCILNGNSSAVSISGPQLTITASVAFQTGFSGKKTVYGSASASGLGSGWEVLGTWTTP